VGNELKTHVSYLSELPEKNEEGMNERAARILPQPAEKVYFNKIFRKRIGN